MKVSGGSSICSLSGLIDAAEEYRKLKDLRSLVTELNRFLIRHSSL